MAAEQPLHRPSRARALLRLLPWIVLVAAAASEALGLPVGQADVRGKRAVLGLGTAAKSMARGAPGRSPPVSAQDVVRHDAVRAAATADGIPATGASAGPAVGDAAGSAEAVRIVLIRLVLSEAALPRVGSRLDDLLFNVIENRRFLSWEGSGPGFATDDPSLDLPESVAPGMAASARRPGLLGAVNVGPRVGGMGERVAGGGGAGGEGGGKGKQAEPVLRAIKLGGRTVYVIRDESKASENPE